MTDFLQAVRERFVVYEGAMGTNIQARGRGEGTFSRNSLRDLTWYLSERDPSIPDDRLSDDHASLRMTRLLEG